jgi:nitrate/TMAO reductase-like tetraheme cytochrome c subunit
MMKKFVLVVGMLLFATSLWAANNVAATRHNLSSTSTVPTNWYGATNEDEVCIFCHTPHGGTLNTPLWNRALPLGTSFTHYTSATLSTALQTTQARAVNTESLLCMSCHDGTVAMNSIINSSGSAPDNNMPILTMFGGIGAVIGDKYDDNGVALRERGHLEDDHPISFSYDEVLNETGYTLKLHTVASARTAGARFFGTDNRVECSSCHNPHADTEGNVNLTPFLVTSNSGSALCLACHIK